MRFCMFTRRISLAGLEKQIQIIIIINGSMNFWSLFVGVITASCAGAVISPPQPTTLGTHHHFFQDAFCYVSLFKKPDRSGRGRERGHSCHSLPSEWWQTPVNIRGVFCVPLLPRVRESPTRQKPRLLNKKKKTPTFCRHSVKFHCICNTLRSDYRSQCNLGDQLIFYYLCMLFKLFPMCFLFTCYSYWFCPVPSFSYLLIFFESVQVHHNLVKYKTFFLMLHVII